MKDEVVVESKNAEDQEDEGSSSSSSEWQVVDETPEDKAQDMMSREQLERDEETLGRDRDDAMAEEFDESRKLVSVHRTNALFCCFHITKYVVCRRKCDFIPSTAWEPL